MTKLGPRTFQVDDHLIQRRCLMAGPSNAEPYAKFSPSSFNAHYNDPNFVRNTSFSDAGHSGAMNPASTASAPHRASSLSSSRQNTRSALPSRQVPPTQYLIERNRFSPSATDPSNNVLDPSPDSSSSGYHPHTDVIGQTSFSDSGHASLNHTASPPRRPSLSYSKHYYGIPTGQIPPMRTAHHHTIENAETANGPTSEIPPPLPPKPSFVSRQRSISILEAKGESSSSNLTAAAFRSAFPSANISHRDQYHYSASEPGHGQASSSYTRYYHVPASRPFSIRRPALGPHPHSHSHSQAALAEHPYPPPSSMHRFRSSVPYEDTSRTTSVFSLSNIAQQQHRSSLSLSLSSKTSRNKLRKAPPPGNGHGRSMTLGSPAARESILRSSNYQSATVDLTHSPPDSLAARPPLQRRHDVSELGLLRDERMCVSEAGHAALAFPSAAVDPPSRHSTLASDESNAGNGNGINNSPERGRRPRQSIFRSSSTTHTSHTSHTSSTSTSHATTTSTSSGGTASTAPTSLDGELSSSDWAGRLAAGQDMAKDEERVGRRARSQSASRKLVKKRPPSESRHAYMRTHMDSPPPLPPLPHPPPPSSYRPVSGLDSVMSETRREVKRSKSILGLRIPFTKTKGKRHATEETSKLERFKSHQVPHTPEPSSPPFSMASSSTYTSSPFSPFTGFSFPSSPSPSPSHFPLSPEALSPTSATHTFDEDDSARQNPNTLGLSSSGLAQLTSRLSYVDAEEDPEEWDALRRGDGLAAERGVFDPYGEETIGVGQARPRPKKVDRYSRAGSEDGEVRGGGPGERMRRWTLAMADVPDEVLVEELERMKRDEEGEWTDRHRDHRRRSQSRRQVKSQCEGEGEGEELVEFGVRVREKKKKSMSMSGHEVVYGGPSPSRRWDEDDSDRDDDGHQRRGKFNIGSVEDGDDDDDSDAEDTCSDSSDHDHRHFSHCSEGGHRPLSVTDPDWTTMSRALLCCRDIIRTERTYLSSLHQLLSGTDIIYSTSHPSLPALIYTYLPDLMSASKAFLDRLEEDPSVWGVGAALLNSQEEMEGAFVRWCGVVGDMFVDHDRDHQHGSKSGTVFGKERRKEKGGLRGRVSSSVSVGFGLGGGGFGGGMKERSKSGVSVMMRKVESVYRPRAASCYGVLSPSETSTFPSHSPTSVSTHTSHRNTRSQSGTFKFASMSPPPPLPNSPSSPYHRVQPTPNGTEGESGTLPKSPHGRFTAWKRKRSLLLSSSVSSPSLPVYFGPGTPAVHDAGDGGGKKAKGRKDKSGSGKAKEQNTKHLVTVRDLAIQPTQRVTRYVLQYRDLLRYTPPSSPSRVIVERALDTALRIAQRCDRAQGNSAFLRR